SAAGRSGALSHLPARCFTTDHPLPMHTLRTLCFAALAVGGTFLLSACDSTDANEPDDLGSFNVQLSAAHSASLNGIAAYATETDPELGHMFAIGLVDGDDEENVIFLMAKGTPEKKTYDLD